MSGVAADDVPFGVVDIYNDRVPSHRPAATELGVL